MNENEEDHQQDRELENLRQSLIAEEDVSAELRARTMRTIASERARARRRAEWKSHIITAIVAGVIATLAFSPPPSLASAVLTLSFCSLYAVVLGLTTPLEGAQ